MVKVLQNNLLMLQNLSSFELLFWLKGDIHMYFTSRELVFPIIPTPHECSTNALSRNVNESETALPHVSTNPAVIRDIWYTTQLYRQGYIAYSSAQMLFPWLPRIAPGVYSRSTCLHKERSQTPRIQASMQEECRSPSEKTLMRVQTNRQTKPKT